MRCAVSDSTIALIFAIGLGGYLIYTLIRPERF
ncbi:MAG: K(+)-transporting ATPase subunit F [Hyphomicrobium sp.]|nr:K(+)-transporting ATPase subunit F [Hyphomicrobium sp.]